MSTATFFLSTGRCGTQWLAAHLSKGFSRETQVVHEPLLIGYRPRQMLGWVPGGAIQPTEAAICHLREVRKVLLKGDYVECGHPCWSSLRWLAQELAGQIRVVHLFRDPIATATSWVTKGAFIPPHLPHVPMRELISPLDPGCSFHEEAARWSQLMPFEKCLIYWAEVQRVALELEKNFPGPWLRLRYEDLFAGNALDSLLEFLGSDHREAVRSHLGVREDKYRLLPESPCDPALLSNHPRVVALARQLGYAV